MISSLLKSRLAKATVCVFSLSCAGPSNETARVSVDTLSGGGRLISNVTSLNDTETCPMATERARIGSVMEGGPAELGVPTGIQVDEAGRVYIADAFANAVRVFDPQGKFLFTFGRLGEGPGELNVPYGLLLDRKGRIWVREARNHRISIFEHDGTFIDVLPIRHSSMAGPWRAGFDLSGDLIDWGLLRPYLIHSDGTWSWDPRARSQTEMTVWPLKLDLEGQVRDTLPPLRYDLPPPGQLGRAFSYELEFSIDETGSVWFGQTDRYQVWRRTLGGDTVLSFTLSTDPSVTSPRTSSSNPVIDRIMTDEGGHVFVFPRTSGIELGTALDAFDTTGVFLCRIGLPVKVQSTPTLVHGGPLYAVVRDSLDVPFVVRFDLHPEAWPPGSGLPGG